jgi:hypothetical protein
MQKSLLVVVAFIARVHTSLHYGPMLRINTSFPTRHRPAPFSDPSALTPHTHTCDTFKMAEDGIGTLEILSVQYTTCHQTFPFGGSFFFCQTNFYLEP